MLSLRESLGNISRDPSLGVLGVLQCRSLRDSMTVWDRIPCVLTIITPRNFLDAVAPLAEFKCQTGVPALVFTLEHIYECYPGRDEAEKVKRCLALLQPNNGLRYVTLVGDQNVFPVRYVNWKPGAASGVFMPIDLYYAALFKADGTFDDWDSNGDGYFGQVPNWNSNDPVNADHVYGRADLAVGRIPASSIDQVKTYVTKVIAYDQIPSGLSWQKSALFVATTDWSANACTVLEDIATKYLASFSPAAKQIYQPTVYRLYQDGNPCGATESLNCAAINLRLNEGVGFVAYVGHGSFDSWGIPGGYSVNEVAQLSNSAKLSVVFAAACFTGSFTAFPPLNGYRDVNGIDHLGVEAGEVFPGTVPQPACLQSGDRATTMAEQMIVGQASGAIAYTGSTMAGASNTELLSFFFERASNSETLGDLWLHMLQTHYNQYPPPDPDTPISSIGESSYAHIVVPWAFNLFGDPSIRLHPTG